MSASFDLEGGKELQDALNGLPDKVSRHHMNKALRAGAVPVCDAAKAICPVAQTSARGYSTAKEHRHKNAKGKTVGSYLKVQPGYGRDQINIVTAGPGRVQVTSGDAYYLNMVEWGTKKIKKPNPFMAEALESASSDASEIIAASLKADIESEFSKGE